MNFASNVSPNLLLEKCSERLIKCDSMLFYSWEVYPWRQNHSLNKFFITLNTFTRHFYTWLDNDMKRCRNVIKIFYKQSLEDFRQFNNVLLLNFTIEYLQYLKVSIPIERLSKAGIKITSHIAYGDITWCKSASNNYFSLARKRKKNKVHFC